MSRFVSKPSTVTRTKCLAKSILLYHRIAAAAFRLFPFSFTFANQTQFSLPVAIENLIRDDLDPPFLEPRAMATLTATRTKHESRIQMRSQYPQPGQPFFLHQIPASLIPGQAQPARLRRKSAPIQPSPIHPRIQIKMRPEYLPPLVIPLRKSSSSHKIRQLQQQQRVPCPVYRPQPIHPIPMPAAPTYKPPPPPPTPTQVEIYELPGDFPTPTPQTPNHPDSAMFLDSATPRITDSPQPLRAGGGGGVSEFLDQETVTTIKAYYRYTLHQSPAPLLSPQLEKASRRNRLYRSSAIYVRNPRAVNVTSPTKSSWRKTVLPPSIHQHQHQQQRQTPVEVPPSPVEPISIQPTPDIIEGISGRRMRSDTYTSVLDDWEREMIDGRADDTREEYQPAQELVNEFGERERGALKELMGFLDEVLGCSSTEEKEEQSVQVMCGMEEGSLWWRDVRRSLV